MSSGREWKPGRDEPIPDVRLNAVEHQVRLDVQGLLQLQHAPEAALTMPQASVRRMICAAIALMELGVLDVGDVAEASGHMALRARTTIERSGVAAGASGDRDPDYEDRWALIAIVGALRVAGRREGER